MKAQKNKRQCLYLQKGNNRWKWMASATAATAAGVSASHASLVTINLTNNYISAQGGNHLNADLTGDGHPDITIANAFNSVFTREPTASSYFSSAGVIINGVRARAFYHRLDLVGYVTLGSKRAGFFGHPSLGSSYGSGTNLLTGSIPIFFKDLHVNGGTPTKGFLEVTVSGNDAEIQLDSFTYASNTPATRSRAAVPDQGSSLALLAMGAGGILALRRWRAAQARS